MLIVGLGLPFSKPKPQTIEEKQQEIRSLIKELEEYLARPDRADEEEDVRLKEKARRLIPQLRLTLENLIEDDLDE